MTIKEFHNSVRSLINVGQQQYYSPEDIDLQINNAIKDLYLQEYKHFEATQFITDTIGFFKKAADKTVTNGQADLPDDYYHLTELEVVLSDDETVVNCEVLKDSEFFNRKSSSNFGPSERFPIARLIGSKKIEILPSDCKTAKIYYLRKPATAKYAYNIDANGTTWTYNAGSSVEIDWPEVGHTMIQDKTISLLGLSLRDNALISSETIRKNQNEGR